MKGHHIFRNPAIIGFLTVSVLVASCKKKDTTPIGGNEPATVLACDYFQKNPDAVLKDNPNAPVDYIVECVMDIRNDVTIEAGVTIAFRTDAGFRVLSEGSLNAVGASNKQITFTGVEKQRGAWGGIYFASNSTKNTISNAIIEYAGGGSGIGPGDIAALKLYSSSSGHASVVINNNTFQHNKNFAINLHTGDEEATINGNRFANNEKPIRLKVEAVHLLDGNNEYDNNDVNKIHLFCYASEFRDNTTWKKASVPYLLYNGSASSGFRVTGNLTVEAGTIIEMSAASQIKVEDNASLKMVGTENDYITIRGVEQTAGFWRNIYFSHTTNPNNILKYVKIHHAGNNPTATKGAVYMWAKPMVTADFVEFKDVLTCAFYTAPSLGGSSANPNLTTSNITYINTAGEICGD